MFQFFLSIAAESRLQDFIRIFVSLEIVGFGSFQPLSDFPKIFFVMKFPDYSSTEFIIIIMMQKKINGFFYGIQIWVHKPCKRRVIIRTGFDIYCSHLNQILFKKIFQNPGMCTICVQLYRITQAADFSDKICKIR